MVQHEGSLSLITLSILYEAVFITMIFVQSQAIKCGMCCKTPTFDQPRVLPQEPGCIEYYNQLFCPCGHLGGVSETQTSLDVSDL